LNSNRGYGGCVRAGAVHLLAGAFLLLVLALELVPAQAGALAIEMESGRIAGPFAEVIKDRRANGGRAVALSGRGAVRRRVTTRRGIRAVVLRARGVPCGGSPRVSLLLDGRRAVSRTVRGRGFRRLRLAVKARAGTRILKMRLANPHKVGSCRRGVVVDWLRVVERPRPAAPPLKPPPAPVTAPAPVAAPAVAPPPAAYRNPVFPTPVRPGRPDPMVLDVGNAHTRYLAFATGEKFPVLRSDDLVNWTPAATALVARPAWADQTGEWNPWAPSVIERPGPCPGAEGSRCFVLFHVSKHGTLAPPTNCIGVAVSPVPEGPYQELGPLENIDGLLDTSGRPPGCGDDGGYSNIDPAPFVDADGRAYLYLSTGHKCQTPTPGASCPFDRAISVIELAPDLLRATGPRLELFHGETAGWELAAFMPPAPVVENPNPVKRGDTYFVLYSGGAFNGPYGMGYATSTSPTGPFVKATENPILHEANDVISVGGGALVTGPRGGDWLAYHGRQGAYANPRELRIDPVRFPTASSVAVDGPTSAPQATKP